MFDPTAQPTTRPALIDTHAHLELEPLVHDPEGVVARALDAGVEKIITVGIDLEDARRGLDIAESFENVYASVGFHPHNAEEAQDRRLSLMEELAGHPKVVAYGEIGLDFFRNYAPHDTQRRVFQNQLDLAKRLRKTVVIHLRDAYDEGMEILEKAAPFEAGLVIHCFSGNDEHARRAFELGFHISIPGTITYKKNDAFRAIVAKAPSDRILLETDCPFLAPVPHRGKDNEPANIVHTAEMVAQVRNVPFETIAEQTTANAKKLFGLP